MPANQPAAGKVKFSACVTVTHAEREAILAAAKAEDRPVANYLRQIILAAVQKNDQR